MHTASASVVIHYIFDLSSVIPISLMQEDPGFVSACVTSPALGVYCCISAPFDTHTHLIAEAGDLLPLTHALTH